MNFNPIFILTLAIAIKAAYLPSTSTTLVKRKSEYPGWVGQFPTSDCSGPVDKTSSYYDYNLADDCKKVDWPFEKIGVNFGRVPSNFTRLVFYTDYNCEKVAEWAVESLDKPLDEADKQCFSQKEYGGPYHSMKMLGQTNLFADSL